jgi:hypothetical protein
MSHSKSAAAPHMAREASRSVTAAVRRGAEDYERRRHLPRLIPVDPALLDATDIASQRWIVSRLARALRAERNRGRAGHWTYDLNRHIGLRQAYAAETALLDGRRGVARGFAPAEPAGGGPAATRRPKQKARP